MGEEGLLRQWWGHRLAVPAQTASPWAIEVSRQDIPFRGQLNTCWPKPGIHFPQNRQTGAYDYTQDGGEMTIRASLGCGWKPRMGLEDNKLTTLMSGCSGSQRSNQPGIQGVWIQNRLLYLQGLICNLFQLPTLCFGFPDSGSSRKTEKHGTTLWDHRVVKLLTSGARLSATY